MSRGAKQVIHVSIFCWCCTFRQELVTRQDLESLVVTFRYRPTGENLQLDPPGLLLSVTGCTSFKPASTHVRKPRVRACLQSEVDKFDFASLILLGRASQNKCQHSATPADTEQGRHSEEASASLLEHKSMLGNFLQ